MASLDGCEHIIPLPFDIRAVSVQPGFQPGFCEHTLTSSDFFGHGYADADRNKAKICDYNHMHNLKRNRESIGQLGSPNPRLRDYSSGVNNEALA